jgi:tripartite-type tricarboxylate transporter receptor subunit TctC
MRKLVPLFLLALSLQAAAQSYPSQPIRMIAPFPPGGALDVVGRIIAPPLSQALGQPVVVENKPGAGSSLAAESVAKGPADGYTFLIASPSSILVNPLIQPKAGFQPMKDLVPVSKVSSSPLILAVNPGLGVMDLQGLIRYLKANPGRVNFSTSGNGSAPHLSAVLFMRLAGVDMVHVPYKGGAPSVQAVLAGDTQLAFATPPSVLPLVQAGRLRALAVTSRNATPLVPGVPGMVQAGLPDYEISFWYGFFVPAGTPAEAVKRLFAATEQALRLPEVAKTLAREGTETSGSASPDDFAAFLAQDAKLWARLVKDSGAKAD